MTTELPTVLYRYADEYDVVLLERYPIVRRTPNGAWIELTPGYDYLNIKPKLKFVLNDATKRFAHETRNGAKTSFLARKRRQLSILHNRIIDIDACVQAINEGRIADHSNTRYHEV